MFALQERDKDAQQENVQAYLFQDQGFSNASGRLFVRGDPRAGEAGVIGDPVVRPQVEPGKVNGRQRALRHKVLAVLCAHSSRQ